MKITTYIYDSRTETYHKFDSRAAFFREYNIPRARRRQAYRDLKIGNHHENLYSITQATFEARNFNTATASEGRRRYVYAKVNDEVIRFYNSQDRLNKLRLTKSEWLKFSNGKDTTRNITKATKQDFEAINPNTIHKVKHRDVYIFNGERILHYRTSQDAMMGLNLSRWYFNKLRNGENPDFTLSNAREFQEQEQHEQEQEQEQEQEHNKQEQEESEESDLIDLEQLKRDARAQFEAMKNEDQQQLKQLKANKNNSRLDYLEYKDLKRRLKDKTNYIYNQAIDGKVIEFENKDQFLKATAQMVEQEEITTQHTGMKSILKCIYIDAKDEEQRNNYLLNQNSKMKINGILDEGIYESDQQLKHVHLQSAMLRFFKKSGYSNNDGAFFPYFNLSQIDLSRYQIYPESDYFDTNTNELLDEKRREIILQDFDGFKYSSTFYNGKQREKKQKGVKYIQTIATFKHDFLSNCLIYALRMSGKIPEDKINGLKGIIIGQQVPNRLLKKVADILKIQIYFHKSYPKSDKLKELIKYGNSHQPIIIHLALFKNHYFLYEDLIVKQGKEYINKSKSKQIKIKSYPLLVKLMNHGVFKVITKNQKIRQYILDREILNQKEVILSKPKQGVDYRLYDEPMEIYNKKLKKKIKTTKKAKGPTQEANQLVFADYESTTNGKIHKEFMISFTKPCDIKKLEKTDILTYNSQEHDDITQDFLDFLPDKSQVYFHNLGYDIAFLSANKKIKMINIIKRGTITLAINAIYKKKKLYFRDSYTLIPFKLSIFNKLFNLGDIKKEVFPYNAYNNKSIKHEKMLISYALNHIKEKDQAQFIENLKTTNSLAINPKSGVSTKKFKIMNYAKFYCERDVEVLRDGFIKFHEGIQEDFKVDITKFLSISAVAERYVYQEGGYRNIYQLSGYIREFIQKAVFGGRVMINSNKKCYYRGHEDKSAWLNDYDAVSMYPTAMYESMGYVQGIPHILAKYQIENIQNTLENDFIKRSELPFSEYYLEISIDKVNRKLDFPLIAIRNKAGGLNYENSTTQSYFCDRQTLEDLIEFQHIEFTIKRGVYFNDGYNDKIKEIIKHLFEERLKLKKLHNPLQLAYKLIMNSIYGKSMLKPILYNTKHIKANEYYNFISKNYKHIAEIEPINESDYIIKINKSIHRHFNMVHLGVNILSKSKNQINKIFSLAQDKGIHIYYQDTDSMHIRMKDIKIVEKAFREKYNKEITGFNLGQFHVDFEMNNDTNPLSSNAIFLGKKFYIDDLKGDKGNQQYHIRSKGINSESITFKANELGINEFQLYEQLFNGHEIEFDLLATKPSFQHNKDMSISSRKKFIRKISFE